MKKGADYTYQQIENFAEANDFHMETEYDNNIVGESFIVLKHNEKDITISFVLSGATSSNYVYECIYKSH